MLQLTSLGRSSLISSSVKNRACVVDFKSSSASQGVRFIMPIEYKLAWTTLIPNLIWIRVNFIFAGSKGQYFSKSLDFQNLKCFILNYKKSTFIGYIVILS